MADLCSGVENPVTGTSLELQHGGQTLFENFFRAKTIVVTGASGYIGSALCRELASFDCDVRGLSRGPFLPAGGGRMRYTAYPADLARPGDWGKIFKEADVVFHLAGQTSARKAEKDPSADYRINVEPLIRILAELKKNNLSPALIMAGTATQIGLSESLPVDERHPDSPLTFYDFHKKIAEDYLKFASRKGRILGVSLRLPNVYGPGAKESAADRGVLNQMIKKAARGEALTLFGDGNYLRDFLYIEDAVRAFMSAAVFAANLSGEHFVIGSGSGYTLKDSLELLREETFSFTGKRPEMKAVMPETPLSLIETRNFIANSQKFSTITGWTPEIDLREGLARSLKELK